MIDKKHEKYMNFAIMLAKKGRGCVEPNPLVGCVIVKDDKIISIGYHKNFGDYHAEKNAILNCKKDLTNATLYVNLEPCCYFGKTPPCTDLIIQKKIKTVVIGCTDLNPLVSGKGIATLKANNINVIKNVLHKQCFELNESFFYFIKTKMPFIIMKYAMTLDGKISSYKGDSKWITNKLSRKNVHKTRANVSAIMVGINTVIKDDPMLNVRHDVKGKNPIRIICDSNLKIPIKSNIVKTAKDIQTYVVCTKNAPNDKIIKTSSSKKVDINELMIKLGELNITSILLEGGGTLNFSFLKANLVNKIHCYISPKIVGGVDAKTPVGGLGFEKINECVDLTLEKTVFFEDDLFLEYAVNKK